MVGAYVGAALSTYGHARLFPFLPADGTAVGLAQGAFPVVLTCLAGGLAAAAIGFLVGLPSLRLRGDYLAIITLGFAQIILVVVRNTKAVDGASAFTGLPTAQFPDLPHVSTPHLTSVFWVYLVAALVLWVSYSLRFSVHGLAFLAVREDEGGCRGDGDQHDPVQSAGVCLERLLHGHGRGALRPLPVVAV